MRHHNSVFHEVLKHVPWDVFERLVAAHGADRRVRQLSTKSQLIALLYGQLEGAASLREIEAGLESHGSRLYHLGASAPRRSTLADANKLRPCAVFAELFAVMAARAHRPLRRALAGTTYLIDATGLRLDGRSLDWARFSAKVCGVKLHLVYDGDADRPIYAAITPARVNDITAAQATRFKRNTPLRVIEEHLVKADGPILSDRIGFLPQRQGSGRRNPMAEAVREVQVQTDSGKLLRILSNDLDATAEEIAELYKRRWAIELFFRWVKQVLKITRFLGISENAVRTQIAVALIAFLLLRLAQAGQRAITSPLRFTRLVRVNLMHKKTLDRLLDPEPPPIRNPAQLAIQWNLS